MASPSRSSSDASHTVSALLASSFSLLTSSCFSAGISYDDDNEQEDESHLLPPLKKGQMLEHQGIVATERFTQRPSRYTEASLVRKLEELGIGRHHTILCIHAENHRI